MSIIPAYLAVKPYWIWCSYFMARGVLLAPSTARGQQSGTRTWSRTSTQNPTSWSYLIASLQPFQNQQVFIFFLEFWEKSSQVSVWCGMGWARQGCHAGRALRKMPTSICAKPACLPPLMQRQQLGRTALTGMRHGPLRKRQLTSQCHCQRQRRDPNQERRPKASAEMVATTMGFLGFWFRRMIYIKESFGHIAGFEPEAVYVTIPSSVSSHRP